MPLHSACIDEILHFKWNLSECSCWIWQHYFIAINWFSFDGFICTIYTQLGVKSRIVKDIFQVGNGIKLAKTLKADPLNFQV
jgi:hypothetical protein